MDMPYCIYCTGGFAYVAESLSDAADMDMRISADPAGGLFGDRQCPESSIGNRRRRQRHYDQLCRLDRPAAARTHPCNKRDGRIAAGGRCVAPEGVL